MKLLEGCFTKNSRRNPRRNFCLKDRWNSWKILGETTRQISGWTPGVFSDGIHGEIPGEVFRKIFRWSSWMNLRCNCKRNPRGSYWRESLYCWRHLLKDFHVLNLMMKFRMEPQNKFQRNNSWKCYHAPWVIFSNLRNFYDKHYIFLSIFGIQTVCVSPEIVPGDLSGISSATSFEFALAYDTVIRFGYLLVIF